MKLLIIFFVFLALIFLDKGLTIMNIKQTWKNFPDATKNDPYNVERNPVAKFFFEKSGLYMGSFFMILISILTLFIIYGIVKYFSYNLNIAIYVVMLIYGFIITNNFYFLLKYSVII